MWDQFPQIFSGFYHCCIQHMQTQSRDKHKVKLNGSSHHLRISIQWLNTFLMLTCNWCKICGPVSQLLPLVYGLLPVMQINLFAIKCRTVVNCTALLKDSYHTYPYKTLYYIKIQVMKISLILLYSIFYLLYRSHIFEKHLNGSTPQNTACAIIMLLVIHNDRVQYM